MNQTLEFAKTNALPLSAGLYGLYSAGKSLKNLKEGEGCRKCEVTGLVLGVALAVYAGVVIYQGWKGA